MLIDTQLFPLFPRQKFEQIVIADFGDFQIAVPTTTKTVKKRIFSAWVAVRERIYHSQGWLICEGELVAYIKELKIGTIFSDKSPFKPIKRLAPGIPLSFNTESTSPLPSQVSSAAAFVCQFKDEIYPYHAVFQKIVPRYVAISFVQTSNSLLKIVEQTLEAESVFIKQNYERLKRVPFYQQSFGL